MPHHKSQKFEIRDQYTNAPLLIFKIGSFSVFSPLATMLLNHIIFESINFTKDSKMRHWVSLSISEFSIFRGYTRQRGYESIKELVSAGLIELKESTLKTSGGVQKANEYRLVSNEKLESLFEVLNQKNNTKGDRPDITPLMPEKFQGDRPDITPCQAIHYTLSGRTLHLVRPYITPLGVNPSNLIIKNVPKYLLNTFKYFLKTINDFENSFLDLYTLTANSKNSEFKIKTKMNALVSQYGLFPSYVAMMTTLFDKTPNIGNFERLNAFIKNNSEKIKSDEEKILKQSIEVFNELLNLNQNLDVKDLESFFKTFRQNASVLLIGMKLDESSMIFFYHGIENEFIESFMECNFNQDRFLKSVERIINLYFKQKIFGIYGLSVA